MEDFLLCCSVAEDNKEESCFVQNNKNLGLGKVAQNASLAVLQFVCKAYSN